MRICIVLVIVALILFVPVEGCMRGGIPGRAVVAMVGLCVIFSPVILVGGAGYLGVKQAEKAVKKVKQSTENRRRTSNLIKSQRNRVVKKVGAKNFENYIQTLYDRTRIIPTPDNLLELGTALFLNNDLSGAYTWLTKAIDSAGDWRKLGSALFVRGMINQYLYDFTAAISDFERAQKILQSIAADAGADLPQITVHDAVNASGYAKMLKALYEVDSVNGQEVLELLNSAITDITIAITTTPEIQGMYHHNRGYTRYHRNFRLPEGDREKELLLAVDDFDMAINSENFGTTAEGHAMKAQCFALIGKYGEAVDEAKKAELLDQKVFLVDLRDTEQLRTPWPLPREKFRSQENAHSFTETKFHRPHYCDHCSTLIPMGPGYICFVCDYRVHKHCHPRVKGKDCWVAIKQQLEMNIEVPGGNKAEMEGEKAGPKHVHHLNPTHFHKPTWCDLCTKIVASPFGKQGFQCKDCGVKLHKDCLDLAGTFFIE